MDRDEWKRVEGYIQRRAGKASKVREAARKAGLNPARVDWEPYLDPKTREEKDACIADGAKTPAARDSVVRRMRST